LRPQSIRKYREIKKELSARFENLPVHSVSVDDVRKLRESWKYSSSTVGKRLELIRSFFSFCLASSWIEKNPTKGVKSPPSRQVPTLPFSDDEWKRILIAVDKYREVHPQSPVRVQKQLRALILLMRYSGLRISDAVDLCPMKIVSGNLFLYTAKTGNVVQLSLPPIVHEALWEIYDEPDVEFFWSGNGKIKTALTEWQERLKKVFRIAGIPSGHSHRLPD
jgi:site-specific recombinase XerD